MQPLLPQQAVVTTAQRSMLVVVLVLVLVLVPVPVLVLVLALALALALVPVQATPRAARSLKVKPLRRVVAAMSPCRFVAAAQ